MKVRIFLLPLAATLLLAACAEKPQPEAPPLAVLVRSAGPAAPSTWRSIPATCVPATRPSWASGWPASSPRAWSTAVRACDQGQALARLDPADLRLSARRRGPIWLRPKPI